MSLQGLSWSFMAFGSGSNRDGTEWPPFLPSGQDTQLRPKPAKGGQRNDLAALPPLPGPLQFFLETAPSSQEIAVEPRHAAPHPCDLALHLTEHLNAGQIAAFL